MLKELYLVFDKVEKLETGCKTAEMIKYTANCLLATMISFANEIGNLCSAVGEIDVVDVMQGVHLDKRLTPILADGERIYPGFVKFIEAGCGFGGSCFPKDVKALEAFGAQKSQPMALLKSVIDINVNQYKQVTGLLYKHFPNLTDVKVAILGLAFKPGTDDVRESPAIPVLKELLRSSAKVKAYDPVANDEMQKLFKNQSIEYCQTLEDTIESVDAILVLTSWTEFNRLPELLKNAPNAPLVVDGRRMLNKKAIQRYEGIGL